MNDPAPKNNTATARGARGTDPYARLRLAALIAVIAGAILLAAAAFVLSYAGIHAIALAAGVSPTLARLYPLTLDAMLVVASAAALALRGAGWWTKFYAWLSIVVLLAAASTADAVHAMGISLPRRPIAAAVAITPWVLLLVAFGLWLAMLRHLRSSRANGRGLAGNGRAPSGGRVPREGAAVAGQAATAEQPAIAEQPGTVKQPATAEQPRPGIDALLGPATGAGDATATGDSGHTGDAPISREAGHTGDSTATADAGHTGDAPISGEAGHTGGSTATADAGHTGDSTATADAGHTAVTDDFAGSANGGDSGDAEDAGLALDAEPGMDDPASDEAHAVAWEPSSAPAAGPDNESDQAGAGESGQDRALLIPQQPLPAPVPAPSPHFDRMRSTPTPPEEEPEQEA